MRKENFTLRRTIEDLKKLLLGLGGRELEESQQSNKSQESQQSQQLPGLTPVIHISPETQKQEDTR